MVEKVLAITNSEDVCFNCLKETKVNKIQISSMGWGSGFDGWSTRINLCEDCMKATDPKWWGLKVIEGKTDWDGIYYEYEKEIFEFVNRMPLAGKELFWNKYSTDNYQMESQDYIDYELGVLPHDKCKEYGMYSHQEIRAYEERFPTCQHPVNLIHKDDSKGCWCPFSAHGDYGQKCSSNMSDECYQCAYYLERTTPIKDMLNEDFNDYKFYYIAKLNQEKYKNKFE